MASNMAQELKRSLQLRKQISISQMGKKRLGFLMSNAFLCRYAIECLERPHQLSPQSRSKNQSY